MYLIGIFYISFICFEVGNTKEILRTKPSRRLKMKQWEKIIMEKDKSIQQKKADIVIFISDKLKE